VVVNASELLRRGHDLVRGGLHPTSVLAGYRMALKEACGFVTSSLAIPVESLPAGALEQAALTSMSSKVVGADGPFFADLVVRAVRSVRREDPFTGEVRYPVKSVNVLKAHGRGARESTLLDGYALGMGRASQGMPRSLRPPGGVRVACLDLDLRKTRLQLGVQVVVTDPKELEAIRRREADTTKERVNKILEAGAHVVLTARGIDDMSLKYFVEAGVLACRRVPKDDLRRIAAATGATVVSSLADMDGEETFDPAALGRAEACSEERVADDDVVVLRGCARHAACTLLLRGANDYLLDEMDRSLHDALCVVRRVLESGSVVPGGGAVEAALSIRLENLAATVGSREQLAIAAFAEALLIVPRTLAVNAARDATELVARLRACHHAAQLPPLPDGAPDPRGRPELARSGLDLSAGRVRDAVAAGCLEPAMSKVHMLRFATEAAITVLRIDDHIQLEAPQEEG